MEAAGPGQRRPAVREAAALVLGALRVRAGCSTHRSAGQVWVSALRLSAQYLLAYATAQAAAHAGRLVFSELLMGRGLSLVSELGHVIGVVLCLVALVAVARGYYLVGIVAAGGGFAAGLWALSWLSLSYRLVDGEFWPLPLAIAATVPLLWRRPTPAHRPLAWLVAVPVALVLLPTAFDASLNLQPYALFAVIAAALLWTVVDARVPVAAAAVLFVSLLSLLGYYLPGWGNGRAETFGWLVAYAGFAVGAVAIGAVVARRRVRL